MNTLFAMSTLILSGGQVVLGLVAVGVAIYLGIFATKTYLLNQSEKIKKQEGIDNTSAIVRKYEAVDIHQHSKNIKLAGFAAAMAMVMIVFAYTQFTNERVMADLGIDPPDDILMEVPPTAHEPELPPALPPPPSEPAVDIIIDDVPETEPKDEPKEITESKTPSDYTGPTDVTSTYVPPAPVLEPEPEPDPIPEPEVEFMIVEQMPRFPGCEDGTGDKAAKKACADMKLLGYLKENLVYPQIARENTIEGTAVISFVVNKDGSIGDYKILRDPGAGCGKEALRVVKMMNKMKSKWTPGKQRGKAVKVRYNLPVRFRLS